MHPLFSRADGLSRVLLELKAIEQVLPVHQAQLLRDMKLLDVPAGLLIDFHSTKLVEGVHRLFSKGANQ